MDQTKTMWAKERLKAERGPDRNYEGKRTVDGSMWTRSFFFFFKSKTMTASLQLSICDVVLSVQMHLFVRSSACLLPV